MDLPEHWDAASVTAAVDALDDLVLLTTAPERWATVSRVLDRIEAALDAGDLVELEDATIGLESLRESFRLIPIGSAPAAGIPARVLERRNELVHRLTGKPLPKGEHDDQRAR
ncbi:hypothetical protein ACTOB_006389 [Actinoplanes oblitus]|uniref:CATRA-Associated Small Protein domain-containing protein n=1 Tax=Actinoplanes oblitus TaxID=3040509 RepID=A0ABY8W928_9ACTN|nr:CATRA system-associated protein [Actinoplanes oblitus]WIM94369.1 hypothetical protein ACTOB_006389 [Actinoplanes oblitus]